MTLEIASRSDNIQTTGSCKSIFMKHPLLHLLFVSLLAVPNNCLSLRFAT